MNGDGKSDGPVVPAKPPNKAALAAAEAVEERGPAKGNTDSSTRPGRRAGQGVPSGLDRVREVARKDKEARFTALLHHVDLPRLWAAYTAINPKAAPGVDQVTWEAYGQDLRANLEDLLARVQRGVYRASPSRRAYIPKADGRLRPLGIATLEDKFLHDLRQRLAKFGLELHPHKTRLIEFGRYAAKNRAAKGLGKPETFDFLGCASSRSEVRLML